MKSEIFINDIFLDNALDYQGRYLILYGGSGAGKSVFAAQKKILRCMQERGHRFLVIRKVKNTLRQSVYQEILDVMQESGISKVAKPNKSEFSFKFKNGNSIISAGLDDPEKLKSIARPTGIWIEEATELTEQEFHNVDLRLRGQMNNYKQIILTFNPISDQHWIKRKFFDEGWGNAKIILSTVYDNKFSTDEDVGILESLPPDLKKVYLQGQWGGQLRGVIYLDWDTNYGAPKGEKIYGLDFGYNNPTALLEIHLYEKEAWIKTLLYQSKLTNNDLIENMKEIGIAHNIPIFADSAEPQRIEEIYNAGFDIRPSDKSVKDGILTVKGFHLHLHPEDVKLQDEIRHYRWDEDKHGELSDEKPVKFKDHGLDAIRYGIHTYQMTRQRRKKPLPVKISVTS